MISNDLLARIRSLTNEQDATNGLFTDDRIDSIYNENGQSVNATVAEMWEIKAAAASELVDVSEAQSSRKMSQVGASALSMAKMYRDRADSGSGGTSNGRRSAVVHQIQR